MVCCMDMIKKAIRAEMKRRGWSVYRLCEEIKDELPTRTIYAYLSDSDEPENKRDIYAKRASIILRKLGLKIKR